MPTFDAPRSSAKPTSSTGRSSDPVIADRQTWQDILKYLRKSHPDLWRAWFDQLEPLGFASGVMQVRAVSDIHSDYLSRKCNQAFADAARVVTNLLVTVRFLGPNEEAVAPPKPLGQATPLPKAPPVPGDGPAHSHAQTHSSSSSADARGNGPGTGAGTGGGTSVGSGTGTSSASANGSSATTSSRPLSLPSSHHPSHGVDPYEGAPAQRPSRDGRMGGAGHAALSGHAPAVGTGNGSSGTGHGTSHGTGHGAGHPGQAAGRDGLAEPSADAASTPPASAVLAELLGPSAGSGSGSGSGHPAVRGGTRGAALTDVYTDGLTINPDNSFENFVQGPENRFAFAAATAVASGAGSQYNPLFIHAAVGLGKTHLLQAVVLGIKARRPDAVIYYTSCDGFMTQFMDAVSAGVMSQFRNKFRHVDVLLIDDIHCLAKRERTQEEFFHTFNALHQAGKQIVLSSDAPPEEIPELEQRLVSRFKWGLVVKLESPTFETREAIVKSKAALRGVSLREDVAGYIAGRFENNIRELEGALTKLQVMADVERCEIDLPLARAALGEADSSRMEPRIQMRNIIDLVTDYFGVTEPDLVSKRRHRSITQPRQVCMYLARKHTRFSLEEIGGHFGDRDHTTVMHAVRTIDDRCGIDAEFKQTMKSLEDRLKIIRER